MVSKPESRATSSMSPPARDVHAKGGRHDAKFVSIRPGFDLEFDRGEQLRDFPFGTRVPSSRWVRRTLSPITRGVQGRG